MKESGVSLVETMLTLVIVMLITGSLIPLHSQLNRTLYNQKLELHASEVAHQGAVQVAKGQSLQGALTVEGVLYSWQFADNSICVAFQNAKKERLKCIEDEQ